MKYWPNIWQYLDKNIQIFKYFLTNIDIPESKYYSNIFVQILPNIWAIFYLKTPLNKGIIDTIMATNFI